MQVAKELIHAARGEMETHTLENLYNKYQTNVASAVAETSDCLLNQDHTELVNEVVGHLEKAKVWATEHGAGAAVHQVRALCAVPSVRGGWQHIAQWMERWFCCRNSRKGPRSTGRALYR